MEIHNQCLSRQPKSSDVMDPAVHRSNGNLECGASSAAGVSLKHHGASLESWPLSPTPQEERFGTGVSSQASPGLRNPSVVSDANSMGNQCHASSGRFSWPPLFRSRAALPGQLQPRQQMPMARCPNPSSADGRSSGPQSSSGHGHSSPRMREPIQVLDGSAPASSSDAFKNVIQPKAVRLVHSPCLTPKQAQQLQAEAQVLIASLKHPGLDDASEDDEDDYLPLDRSPALTPEECRQLQAEMQLLLHARHLE